MSKKQVNVAIALEAILMIDKEKWPDDWDLKKEIGHQLTLDDALEVEIVEVKVVGP